jgi:hypothetical protein
MGEVGFAMIVHPMPFDRGAPDDVEHLRRRIDELEQRLDEVRAQRDQVNRTQQTLRDVLGLMSQSPSSHSSVSAWTGMAPALRSWR